ncbi:hypothetical protein [Paraburkholderia xenovorans]|uniref:hypothetical protein n=1 Tax=Paraburkholderia xenovorans TaxID=36873 RepID=UPI0038B8000E
MLAKYAIVLQLHRDRPIDLGTTHPGFINLHEVEYAQSGQCMAERCADFVAGRFNLDDVVVSNGINPPKHLRLRRCDLRVALHPEASTDDKR